MQFVMLALFGWFTLRALFRPFEGLIGLLAVTMINPGEIYPLINSLHVERLLSLLTVVGLFIRPERLVWPPLTKKVLIFYFSLFLTIPFSFWPGGAFDWIMTFGHIILYHVLIVNLVDTQKKFVAIVITMALLTCWVGGGALWGYAHGSFDEMAIRNGFERATGLTESNGNPNTIGLTMLTGLPLVILLFAGASFKRKLMAVAVTITCFIAILLTGSRTSFVILCIMSLALLMNRKMIKFLPVVIVLAVVSWSILPDQYRDRYRSIISIEQGKEEDASYIEHMMARQAGKAMFLDNPLTGVGAGQFAIADGMKYWPGPNKIWLQPHNLYVQLPAELGIVGIITWSMFMVVFVKLIWHWKKEFKLPEYDWVDKVIKGFPRACIYAIAAMFIGGMFGHTLYRYTWYQLAGMMAALDRIIVIANAKLQESDSSVHEDANIPPEPSPLPLTT